MESGWRDRFTIPPLEILPLSRPPDCGFLTFDEYFCSLFEALRLRARNLPARGRGILRITSTHVTDEENALDSLRSMFEQALGKYQGRFGPTLRS